MNPKNSRAEKRQKRKLRIRKNILGTSDRPRMSIFKSNRNLSVQLIDDVNETTLCAVSTLEKPVKVGLKSGAGKAAATSIGKMIAERAKEKKIEKVVFDRNGFFYHGVVKDLADSAREAGLKF